jgi:glycosyltransferase involved in cell wall biosynthesis
MKSSDIVLVPSKAEGFGLVLLEAYSVKKPIVYFDVPALNEIVINQKTGLLVAPYSTSDFTKSIKYLLNNKKIAKNFGEQGYQYQKEAFYMKVMIDKTIKFYHSCLVS